MTASTTSHSVRCANNKRTRVVISCSICAVAQRNRIRHGTSVWFFCKNLPGLIRSFAETGEDLHLSLRFCKTSRGSCSGIRHRTIPADRFGATVGRYLLHHMANAVNWKLVKSGLQESRPNQSGVTEEIVPDDCKPKRRLTWRVTRTECCESIFLKLPEATGRW